MSQRFIYVPVGLSCILNISVSKFLIIFYSQNYVDSYLSSTCPANSQSGSNSQDGNGEYQQKERYASIKGYDYATDRCYCYTDGSGCDCDDQDENRAVRNIASYGPATICVDASLWQDYNGGIIESSSGCSQGKLLDLFNSVTNCFVHHIFCERIYGHESLCTSRWLRIYV